MERTRWTGLAQDVARDIAGRLRDAADFVRFHAVCKSWRHSHDAQPPLFRTPTNQFLPWLLAVADDGSTPLYFRCIFSKSSYRTQRPPPPFTARRIWVCNPDATAVRYLTVEHLCPSLHDPLTGEVTQMPCFPYNFLDEWDEDNREGILYGDGTILLYNNSRVDALDNNVRFRAALLRSGDTKWTLVERTLENPHKHGEFCAAYHGGRILVAVESYLCCVITPEVPVSGDVLLPRTCDCRSPYNYILDSRGELLWLSVHARTRYTEGHRVFRAFSVFVHALEEVASTPEKMRWVRKGGSFLDDRVLFLGSPNSLAIDASKLGVEGGSVFFSYYTRFGLPREQFGVYRYSFINDNTKFVERLPQGWDEGKCSWLVPQPTLAPIQEIAKKSLKAPEREEQQHEIAPITHPTRIIHILRHHEPPFRVLVRNLPPTVDSSQLEALFNMHGKVSSAEVLYYKKTWRSRGFSFVTMSTVHANLKDALDALTGMLLDGRSLEVILEKEERPRCHRRQRQRLLPS